MARRVFNADSSDRNAVSGTGGGSEPSIIDPTEFDKGGSEGGSDGDITIDGDTAGGFFADSGTIPVKRRGRKPGSKNRKTAQVPLDVNGIEKLLYSCHMMLAGLTQTPELELSQSEANNMAAAAVAVSRHYEFVASQKMLDWGNLILVVGVTYGSKFAAINAKKKREKMRVMPPTGNSVTPIIPTNAPKVTDDLLAQLATHGKIPS